jgi:hypothetical protein
MRRVLLLSTAALLAVAPLARAQLQSIETKHFEVVYFGTERYLAEHAARCFENALASHMKTFDYQPSEKITILLHDFGDTGNAGASAVPNDRILVTIAPFSYMFEVVLGNERMNWLASHELVHIMASDKASSRDMRFRRLFGGKVVPSSANPPSLFFTALTTPRQYAPRWYHEGIAVFMETWLTGGLGRAMGAYDEMVFRTKVAEDAPFYDIVGLESASSRIDFQVGVNAYLYGARFMSYLAYRYGPAKLVEWVSGVKHRKPSYAADFRRVYGLPLAEAWKQWIAFEHDFQHANLERLRANPVTPYRPVTATALGSVSRAVVDRDGKTVYVAVNYPGQVAHVAAIDLTSGKTRRLADIKGAALFYVASLALDTDGRTLFYTTDNNDLRDLRAIDLSSGRDRLCMKDGRIGDIVFDLRDRALWGVRHYNGISTLVRIPPPYKEWIQVHSYPYGTDIYDLDLSPDGSEMVAAMTHIDGSQSLVRMRTANLLAGDVDPEVIQDFESSSPAGFVFSADGRTLYGSSYYSGVSNLYRVDLDTGDVSPITNADTGYFHPLPLPDGRLFAFRFTSGGFLPVTLDAAVVDKVGAIRFLGQEIVEKYPEVRGWKLPPPSTVDLAALGEKEHAYSPFATTRMRSIAPAIFGYKDDIAVGVRTSFTDALGFNRLSFAATYTPRKEVPSSERLHLQASYSYLNWKVDALYNPADFYDLFGPVKRSRKGYSLGVEYKKYLIFDEPNRTLDYQVNVSGWGNLETLPGYQNIASTAKRLGLGSFSIGYKNERNSLGAVRAEKGIEWRVTVGDSYARGAHFPSGIASLDLGVALPLNHSSLWLRTAAGAAGGNREEPFANFYFGSFRNNWVDDKPYRRFTEVESFPGFAIDELAGHTFAKAMLEWNAPPLIFRHVGSPSFFFNWAALAVFASGIVTDFDESGLRRKVADVGTQLDLRFVAMNDHQFTLSFGYAVAFEKGRDRASEFMASLMIPLYE